MRLHRDHNHLSWVTEARILEAVREAKGEGPHSSSTSQEAGHGRETERVLADMGWLSELPRTHTERCRGSHYRRREGLPVFLRKEGSKPGGPEFTAESCDRAGRLRSSRFPASLIGEAAGSRVRGQPRSGMRRRGAQRE